MPGILRARLLELASLQHGVVATHQARALGSRHQAHHELSGPTWRSELSGVFGVAGAPRTPLYVAMARLLRSGPGAVVSHHSALWLWGVLPEHLDPLHITRMRAANGSKLRRDGIVPHETRKMPGHHVTSHRGFPIVVPARALADVAATTPLGRVERWLDRAWTSRLVDYGILRTVLDDLNKRGRRGIRPLSMLVEQRGRSYVPPESGLESRLNGILRRADMPPVRRQVDVGGQTWLGRVDFRVGDTPILIEVQSDAHHWSLSSSDDDARRTAAIEAAGFVVVEVWESAIWHDPASAIGAVEAALRDLQR